jgi:hypothetical protein
MSKLGKLIKIEDLRTIWKHEERDFSAWLTLEENLALLSEAIGLDIVLEERESPVGKFSLDIMAYEEGTDRKIIIENQLEDTDHDHLGKVITYAAGKDADVIIWIVKRARDEHRKAIDWLNEHMDESITFFLIELQLWQIEDSPLAPKFQVIVEPNDWVKSMKVEGQLSETRQLQYRFWQAFVEYAGRTDFSKSFNLGKTQPRHWYNLGIGISGAQIGLTVNTQKNLLGAEIYIPDDKELFKAFCEKKAVIESEAGFSFDWQLIPDGKASRIIVNHSGNIRNENKWEEYFKWYMEKAKKIKEVFNKYR